MANTAKKSNDSFIPMKHTRAMLNDVWDHWLKTLGHTPDKAKKMMTAAINEMHKTETTGVKKFKATKKAVKRAVSKARVTGKAKTVKRRKKSS